MTSLVALLVYVASAAHLRSQLARIVSAIVVLLPMASEVPDAIANAHWYGLYAVFWVLLWTPRRAPGGSSPSWSCSVAGSDVLVLVFSRLLWYAPFGGRRTVAGSGTASCWPACSARRKWCSWPGC